MYIFFIVYSALYFSSVSFYFFKEMLSLDFYNGHIFAIPMSYVSVVVYSALKQFRALGNA